MNITPQQTSDRPCVYCSLPELKAREVTGNKLVWAFPTNIPITPGHILVSPRRCVARLVDLTLDEWTAVFSLAEEIQDVLREIYDATGFNCVWNEGKLAGQSVPHFHLHIIPRKDGDTGLLGYDPRSMLYRTGDREPSLESEILAVRDQIRAALGH